MALSPIIPAAPLVADILFIAHGGRRHNGIALEFRDLDGNSLASGLTDPDALDAIGRQALAVAAAARACDPAVVPIGQRPRSRATLLPQQSTRYRLPEPLDAAPEPEPAPDGWTALDGEARALAYMIVACAALALAVALVAWDLLK